MNSVTLIGRITRDPEVRRTQTNIATVAFSLAVERNYKDQAGNRPVDFINCVAWRSQADYLANYVKKGYLLAVEGRIQTRSYQDQTGVQRFVTEVLVNTIEILAQPRGQESMQAGYNNRPNNYGQGSYNQISSYNQGYDYEPQPMNDFRPSYENQMPEADLSYDDADLPF